jgi:hypothetical protein
LIGYIVLKINHYFKALVGAEVAVGVGSFLISKERTRAIEARQTKIIIGRGGEKTSAIKGANVVAILDPMLHIPKAVPAKMAGKI